MRLRDGARIAVIGAGPAGLVAAKHALEAGFEVHVFEAQDDLGGQWYTTSPRSGVWPGMRTNTSRWMTAFSDFPVPSGLALHPLAEEIHAYLRAYADAYGVTPHIEFGRRVEAVRPGWIVDGERFDAVVVASGRFHARRLPGGLGGFTGELLHAYDYPGANPFRDRGTLVYGNGVSGHEIASDIADLSPVISAYRKPRYVLQKVSGGVSSDWQWYTHVGALRRRTLPREQFGRMLRDRVIRVAGNPADFGAPAPDDDILRAGHSLCQNYLAQVRDGSIVCRPAIDSVSGRTVTFTDGSRAAVDAIVCATGYDLEIPYLDDEVWERVGADLRLHLRTWHPDLPGIGFIGQYATSGPYFPLLELQARWIVNVWSGAVDPPDESEMRAAVAEAPPPLDSHDALALTLSEASSTSPDIEGHSELFEALLFGPMLPPRYRLDGPGAMPNAADMLVEQMATSPRAPVEPDDLASLSLLGVSRPAADPAVDFPAGSRSGR
jgi:cation diffusion facilitator CzcD-associated flavoprotein CzcO